MDMWTKLRMKRRRKASLPRTLGNFQYTVQADGTARIIRYTGNAAVLDIPARLQGRKVTEIGDDAFANNTTLTSVIIPEGVISIGDYDDYCGGNSEGIWPCRAFANCTALQHISLPDSLTFIGQNVFSGCSSLTEINLPKGIEFISEYLFQDCTSLTHVEIPNGVRHICAYAFSGCTALPHVNIPYSVEVIDRGAFYGCASLTRINLPWRINRLDFCFVGFSSEKHLFDRCPSLKGVCVDRISYAESWCRANGIPRVYTTGGGFDD